MSENSEPILLFTQFLNGQINAEELSAYLTRGQEEKIRELTLKHSTQINEKNKEIEELVKERDYWKNLCSEFAKKEDEPESEPEPIISISEELPNKAKIWRKLFRKGE